MLLHAVVALLLLAVSPWANIADPVFRHIDTTGLPHPAVYAITQDTTGYIWVGTPAGLARFDGYAFKNYTNTAYATAPPEAQVLLAGRDGGIWIGTTSSGLSHFDARTQTFTTWRADPTSRSGPRSATVIALASAGGGRIWIGGDAGLDEFDPARNVFTHVTLPASNAAPPRVEALLTDRSGGLWVGTTRGLYLRRSSAPDFVRITPRQVFSVSQDANGTIHAGSPNQLDAYNKNGTLLHTYSSTTASTSLAPGEQWASIEVNPGIIWTGSSDGGISIVNEASHSVRRIAIDRGNPSALAPGAIWQFFRDRSGLIWIANSSGGLLQYNPANRGIFQISASNKHLGSGDLGARAVGSSADGSLWLGGSTSVMRIAPSTDATATYQVANHSVQSLYVDRSGTLWIGTLTGLCVKRDADASVSCPGGSYEKLGRVFAILETQQAMWLGTGTGLVERGADGSTTIYRRGTSSHSISNDFVNMLFLDRSGFIWAGTSNGLNRIDPRTQKVERYVRSLSDEATLGSGSVSSIAQDRRGRLWVGAVGGSLNLISENVVQRLSSQDVDGLAVAPDGTVWASAVNALLAFDPVTLRYTSFGHASGVAEPEFWTRATAESADGTIFFGGTTGVTIVAPGANADWNYNPPIVVTSTKYGDHNRDFSVEFSALDYSSPESLRYQYKLDGYDRDWVFADASHRIATYTNLNPGNYTLLIRGTNRLGVWSDKTVSLPISTAAMWYQTWWFRVFIALALLAAGYVLHLARTAVLRRNQQRLETMVAERTTELSQANRKLEEASLTDPLTGLYNRRFLVQHLETDIAAALRDGTDIIFFMVDVDHFKKVNDELGHHAGDIVLQQMRDRLGEVFRESDFVIRWGGEEFLGVARGSKRAEAGEIAERIRKAIADRPFQLDNSQTLAKTASIGFAAFPFIKDAPKSVSWLQVVEIADRALYFAKDSGRNTWFGLEATATTSAASLNNLKTIGRHPYSRI